MKLTSVSIKRPVAVSMFFIGVTIFSLFSFNQIGVDLLPDISIPHLLVQTTWQNATPEEIEKLVTEPLESAAGTLNGIKNVSSVSKGGLSLISIDLQWGTNVDFAVLSLREKLDNVRFTLPKEAGRPTIIRADPSSAPIMTLVMSYGNKNQNNNVNYISNNTLNEKNEKLRFADINSSTDEIQRLVNLRESARNIIKRRLEQIEGVAQAIITGGLERQILIEAEPAILNAYNLSFKDIASAIRTSNINMSAGSVLKGSLRYSLRALGEYRSLADIENTVVKKNTDGSSILLSNVATVKESFKEREGFTRMNGMETVGVLIYKEPQSNTVSIAEKIKETLTSLKKQYPEFSIVTVADQSEFIENAISNVKQEIMYGGALAVLVLFFFLGNIRNIFIIAITIPSSLILTVLLMYLFKIDFNIVSLGGIALGVGMLLDNAIIMIENVTRYSEMGYSKKQSAILGSKEVSMPIIASTFTTIAVFFPLIFLKGISGELFKEQSLAIAFSLISSIISALTLVPMLASRDNKLNTLGNKVRWLNISNTMIRIEYPEERTPFYTVKFWILFPLKYQFRATLVLLKSGMEYLLNRLNNKSRRFLSKTNNYLEYLTDKYEMLLGKALDNRKIVLAVIIILVVLAVLSAINMKKEFVPDAAQNQFVIEAVFPPGISLKGNAEISSKIENAVGKIDGIEHVFSNIGRVNDFDIQNREKASANKANYTVKLSDYESYYDIKAKTQALLSKVKGLKFTFRESKSTFTQVLKPSENDIVIKIKNQDINEAYKSGEIIVEQIRKAGITGISEVRMGTDKGIPQYRVNINREKCLACGISPGDAAEQIIHYVKGNEVSYFSDFDKKIQINLTTSAGNKDDIDKILGGFIHSPESKIPVKSVVDYNIVEGFDEICHEDQGRIVYVYASVSGSSIDQIIENIKQHISKIPEKEGQAIIIGGTNDEINSSFSLLYGALTISVLLMYMVLASEFESFLIPLIIILSVPLGLIGGIISLYLLGESLSIISLMGLVILVGIADNDAVVKVEFILRKRREGLSAREAIIAAGKDRFRPIVMNSLTVIFGLMPMMIGVGAATQLRTSLSIAIAGGLLSSTVLTLLIIPVLYLYLDSYYVSRKKEGFTNNQG